MGGRLLSKMVPSLIHCRWLTKIVVVQSRDQGSDEIEAVDEQREGGRQDAKQRPQLIVVGVAEEPIQESVNLALNEMYQRPRLGGGESGVEQEQPPRERVGGFSTFGFALDGRE